MVGWLVSLVELSDIRQDDVIKFTRARQQPGSRGACFCVCVWGLPKATINGPQSGYSFGCLSTTKLDWSLVCADQFDDYDGDEKELPLAAVCLLKYGP